MALSNGDGCEQFQESVQNMRRRLRKARCHALTVGISRGLRQPQAAGIRARLRQLAKRRLLCGLAPKKRRAIDCTRIGILLLHARDNQG